MSVKVNLKTRILYQGKEYDSPDDLPPAARQAYEQALAGQPGSSQLKINRIGSKITIDGQTYNSIDEIPPEKRGIYETVMASVMDKNQAGIPDALQSGGLASSPVTGGLAPSAPLIPQENVISPAPPNKRLLVASIGLLMFLFFLAALILIFFRRGG